MDRKMAKNVLHDLDIIENEDSDIKIKIDISINGNDFEKLKNPNILLYYYKKVLLTLRFPILANGVIRSEMKGIIEAEK